MMAKIIKLWLKLNSAMAKKIAMAKINNFDTDTASYAS